MSGPLVVVGDALLDVDLTGTASRLAPDAPVPVVEAVTERARPGGAALAAYLAARDGRDVVLVAPLADDGAGARLRALLAPHLRVVELPFSGSTAVKTRVRVAGQSLVRIDTGGAAGQVGAPGQDVRAALAGAGGVLVADYGRGAAATEAVRSALGRLPARTPVVWDPHPRGAAPVPGARLVTPNAAEALHFAGSLVAAHPAPDRAVPTPPELASTAVCAAALVRAWRAAAVAVTLGARGALVSYGEGAPLVVPAPHVACSDPCGAGDRFAVTAAALLADGALPSEAVQDAVRAASAFVAAGGASGIHGNTGVATGATAMTSASGTAATDDGPDGRPPRPVTRPMTRPADPAAVIARVRAAGGTVVATGGCFDLVHAGHVATLRAARALGDCLVVCLNSDDSVRRLKGAERPLQTQQDRACVLDALECVDAVAVFDEDTPEAVLDRLRPDVWAKGGDYAGVELPESRLLAGWGGQTVVLPYLDGRSTTGLVRRARALLPHVPSTS